MKKIKSLFSKLITINKLFTIKTLNVTLYFFTIVLFFSFIYTSFISIAQYKVISDIDLNNIDSLTRLFQYMTLPFTIGAATLAFLTLAVTTSRTIRMDNQLIEMQNQREASYLPDIVVAKSQFIINTGFDGTNSFYKLHNGPTVSGIPPNIKLLNIGRGVAKKINYYYYYDIDEVFNWIKQYDLDNLFIINVDKGMLVLESNIIKIPHLKYSYETIKLDRAIDYMLSNQTANYQAEVTLPYSYLLLRFLYDIISYKYFKKNQLDITLTTRDFVPLTLKCEYQDIGGKLYKKTFDFTIICYVFQNVLDSDNHFKKLTYTYQVSTSELQEK